MYDPNLEILERFNVYLTEVVSSIIKRDTSILYELNKQIDALFELNDDLISTSSAKEYEAMFKQCGFDVFIRQDEFLDTPYVEGETDFYYGMAWHKDGILLEFELNNNKPCLNYYVIYFNWIPNVLENKTEEELSVEEKKLIGEITYMKCKWNRDKKCFGGYLISNKGLKTIMEVFKSYGKFINPWVVTNPIICNLYLKNTELKVPAKEIFHRIPEDIRMAIGLNQESKED